MSGYTERVARGAALLDARMPGWDALIDLGTLDLEDSGSCILGQTYSGNYFDGVDDLFPDGGKDVCATEHGFLLPDDRVAEYDYLTAEWARLLVERRNACVVTG